MCQRDTYGIVRQYAENPSHAPSLLAFEMLKKATTTGVMFGCLDLASPERLPDMMKIRVGDSGASPTTGKSSLFTSNGINEEVVRNMTRQDFDELMTKKCAEVGIKYPGGK
jgi:hypothetical protein